MCRMFVFVLLSLVGSRAAQRGGVYLVGAELCPVEPAQRVLHVLPAEELHHAFPVALHVCETNVPSLAHVILQVLPAPARWQPWRMGGGWQGEEQQTCPGWDASLQVSQAVVDAVNYYTVLNKTAGSVCVCVRAIQIKDIASLL